ncbi:nudix hydrolase [Acrasis kona]|uniref:Nudix hydrolase n=1 Tax=Acrasis kona TaxID=1008807 RepID=A0AAW2ZS19_9EUKA
MKEYIEVFTPDGNPTGVMKSREEIHRDGLWHNTVHTWIIKKSGMLLIQRRCATKESHPDMWDVSSAGHISFGQSSKDAAVREVEEEVGLYIKQSDLEFLFRFPMDCTLKNGEYLDREHIDVYLVEVGDELSTSDLTLQESEVSDAQFVHYSIIEKMYREFNKKFVQIHDDSYYQLFDILKKRYPVQDLEINFEIPSFLI